MADELTRRLRHVKPDGPAQEALLSLLVAASHVRQLVDKACAAADMTHGQYTALRILRAVHPRGYPRGEIAARMVERAPDITRLIDRLEKRGLVARSRVSEDRRLSVTRITRAGLDVLRRLDPHLHDVHRRFSARVVGRDLRELSRICEEIYGIE